MIPLILADPGEEAIIKKVGGKDETRRFLESLGFVVDQLDHGIRILTGRAGECARK